LAGAAALTGGLALVFGGVAGGATAAPFAFPHSNVVNGSSGSGYSATFPRSSTTNGFLATYVVPSITCSVKDTSPIETFFAEEGDNGGGAALVIAGCDGLQPIYEAGLTELGPNPFVVNPGDVLTVSVEISPSAADYAITDVTSGLSASISEDGFANANAGVEIGLEGANSGEGISPRFSRALFSGVSLNGVPLKLSHPVAHDQVSPSNRPQIKVTPLYHNGESFTVTWASSAGAPVGP
jgi:hypothetical protein